MNFVVTRVIVIAEESETYSLTSHAREHMQTHIIMKWKYQTEPRFNPT